MEDSDEDSREKKRIRDLVVDKISYNVFPKIPEPDIRRILGYLENFCKLTNNGNIPLAMYKRSGNCSIFWMQGKVTSFLLNNATKYNSMTSKEIIIKMLGAEEYNKGFETYSRSPISRLEDEEDMPLLPEDIDLVHRNMEDVDGGSKRIRQKKTTKRMTKRMTKTTRKRMTKTMRKIRKVTKKQSSGSKKNRRMRK